MSVPASFQYRDAMAFVLNKFNREIMGSQNIQNWTPDEDLAEFRAHFCTCICYSMHQIYHSLEHWQYPMLDGTRIARAPLQVRGNSSKFLYVSNKFKRFIVECFEHVLNIGPRNRVHVISSLDSDTDYYHNQHMTFSLHYKGMYYRFRLEEFGDAETVQGGSVRHWCFCSPIKLQYDYVH